MKNNGKSLEKAIRLIHETLKDSENTEIFNNFKIENESGQKREIDILIVSTINNFTIKIAIECKDYSKKVPVKEIEAFQSKCDRIKEINKKVFVSSSGYQTDAIHSAKYFGIELHTADKLSSSDINSWFPIEQMGLQINPHFIDPTFFLKTTIETYSNISKTSINNIYKDNEIVNINAILLSSSDSLKQAIMNHSLIEWLKIDDIKRFDFFPLKLNLSLVDYYIKLNNDEKIPVARIETTIQVKFVKKSATIIDSRNVKDANNTDIAKSITIALGKNIKSDIIIDNNNEMSFFATNEKGQTEKLQHLFTYDSNTKKFSK